MLTGGRPFTVLLFVTLFVLVMQNAIGVGGAVMFGLPMQAGVLFRSAPLVGGHGTAIAWADEVAAVSGMENALELGVSLATLGLILAAVLGGPVAKFIIDRNNLHSDLPESEQIVGVIEDDATPDPTIDHTTLMQVILWLNLSVALGYVVHRYCVAAGITCRSLCRV